MLWLGKLIARLMPRFVIRGVLHRVWDEVCPPDDPEAYKRVTYHAASVAWRRRRRSGAIVLGIRQRCPHCRRPVVACADMTVRAMRASGREGGDDGQLDSSG